MTRRITRAILVLLLFAAGNLAQSDRRIEAIDSLRRKIDQDIAAREAEPEYSTIYLIELAVNKDNGSYPAVGVYHPVVKFYYTYATAKKNLIQIGCSRSSSPSLDPIARNIRSLCLMNLSSWFSISRKRMTSNGVCILRQAE